MAVKLNLSRLSDHYLAALRIHLAEGARARLEPAWLLGREAVVLGLATPELARIHKRALAALELPRTKNATLKRAEKFFSEVNSCLKVTQRAARPSTVHGSPGGGVPSHQIMRSSKRRERRAPGQTEFATPHYSTGTKAAMLMRKRISA